MAVAMASKSKMFLGFMVLFCQNVASQNDLDVPAIIIFGDSTVDVGNNNILNTIMRSSHLPYGRSFGSGQPTGRFSDGNLAVDYIADKLNLSYPLAYSDSAAKGNTPNLLHGINFASAGSGLMDSTSKLFNTIDFAKQLTWFDDYKTRLAQVAGQAQSQNLISKALYIISTGNNDYVYYRLNPTMSSNYNPQQFSSMVLSKFAGYVEQIHARGARRIAIVSVAPLGCLPSEMTAAGLLSDSNRKCVDSVNDMARSYNAQLQRLIPSLHSQLPDAKVAYLDCFDVIYDAVQNPAKYGFIETRKGCCGSGLIEDMRFANSVEEFNVYMCLPNVGRDPSSLRKDECTTEDFLRVWQSELKDGKIKLHQIRPQFADELHDMVTKIYQFGLKNKEARTQFAKSFAWQHTRRAIADPASFKINWARFAANSLQHSKRTNQKRSDSSESSLKHIASALVCLEADMQMFSDEVNQLELELKQKETHRITTNGVLLGIDLTASCLVNEIKEVRQKIEDIRLISPEEDVVLKQLSDDENRLGLSLLSILAKKKQADDSAEIEKEIDRVNMLITLKKDALLDLQAKVSNLKHLREIYVGASVISPAAGNWPFADGVSGCHICGMAFCTDYELHVQLICGHKYHLFCFQLCIEKMHCHVCHSKIPDNLFLELGYMNFVSQKKADVVDVEASLATSLSDDSAGARKLPTKLDVKRVTRSMVSPKSDKGKKLVEEVAAEDEDFDHMDQISTENMFFDEEEEPEAQAAAEMQVAEPNVEKPASEKPAAVPEPTVAASSKAKNERKNRKPKRFQLPVSPVTRAKAKVKGRVTRGKSKAKGKVPKTKKAEDNSMQQATQPDVVEKVPVEKNVTAEELPVPRTSAQDVSSMAKSWNSSQVKNLWFQASSSFNPMFGKAPAPTLKKT